MSKPLVSNDACAVDVYTSRAQRWTSIDTSFYLNFTDKPDVLDIKNVNIPFLDREHCSFYTQRTCKAITARWLQTSVIQMKWENSTIVFSTVKKIREKQWHWEQLL